MTFKWVSSWVWIHRRRSRNLARRWIPRPCHALCDFRDDVWTRIPVSSLGYEVGKAEGERKRAKRVEDETMSGLVFKTRLK